MVSFRLGAEGWKDVQTPETRMIGERKVWRYLVEFFRVLIGDGSVRRAYPLRLVRFDRRMKGTYGCAITLRGKILTQSDTHQGLFGVKHLIDEESPQPDKSNNQRTENLRGNPRVLDASPSERHNNRRRTRHNEEIAAANVRQSARKKSTQRRCV